jgi:hypothetical protein
MLLGTVYLLCIVMGYLFYAGLFYSIIDIVDNDKLTSVLWHAEDILEQVLKGTNKVRQYAQKIVFLLFTLNF